MIIISTKSKSLKELIEELSEILDNDVDITDEKLERNQYNSTATYPEIETFEYSRINHEPIIPPLYY